MKPIQHSHELGLDVVALVDLAHATRSPVPTVLSDAAAEIYKSQFSDCVLVEFDHHGASYLFDVGTDRTVLVHGTPSLPARSRESSYQRGYPIPTTSAGRAVDRGHFFPHASGGGYGPNLFPQDRALNRGWSVEGREYRALERRAIASRAGSLFFAHPIYNDLSSMPDFIQLGLIADTTAESRTFRNRFDSADVGSDQLQTELSGATDAQIGSLGEETVAVFLEEEMDATIVALGDSGMPRTAGRQDLDVLAIIDGELVAFEVKTRLRSQVAGRFTRAGNLLRPRLRRGTAGQVQARQPYLADRLHDFLDIDDQYDGVEARVVVVDLVSMLLQIFAVDDTGRRLQAMSEPTPCARALRVAYERIVSHRGRL